MIEDFPRVKVRRQELGMSQYALAKAVRKSQSYIAKIETGKTQNPGVSIAMAMAAALKTSVEELFGNLRQAA